MKQYISFVNVLLISVFCTIFSSCQDFTEANLELAPQEKSRQISEGVSLLSNKSNINRGEFSINKLLANIGVNVVSPLINELNNKTEILSTGIQQHCSSLDILDDLDEDDLSVLRAPLQDQWVEVMSVYHQLELMKFGPAAFVESTAMDSLYSFDGEDKCRVDLQLLLVERGRFPRFDVIDNYSVRGLDAIEPLIFSDPNTSRCARVNSRLKAYFEKPLLERERLACQYMEHLLIDMTKKSNELAEEWAEGRGDYLVKLLTNKKKTPIENVNEVSQGLFTLDTLIKDIKLAYPAGFEIRINEELKKCPNSSCPENREHPFSDLGLKSLKDSLTGFKNIFTGTHSITNIDGFGFDDLLKNRNHKAIADNIILYTNELIDRIENIGESKTFGDLLKEYSQSDCENSDSKNRKVEVCSLVWDLRKVTDLLKNEYLLALSELSAPKNASGDND